MKRFWVSWYQPTDDCRPIKWPLPEFVLGFWSSGERLDPPAHTLCVLIECLSVDMAKAVIHEFWPESTQEDFRFCEEKAEGWLPGDRFPIPAWSSLAASR